MWLTVIGILSVGELVIPDVRYEIDDTSGFQFAWPLGLTPIATESFNFKVSAEPQYSFADDVWRLGGWGQVGYFFGDASNGGFGTYVQGGYLSASDGSGPFGTLGLALGTGHTYQWGIFSRYGEYDGEERVEFGIDVQVHAFWVLFNILTQ